MSPDLARQTPEEALRDQAKKDYKAAFSPRKGLMIRIRYDKDGYHYFERNEGNNLAQADLPGSVARLAAHATGFENPTVTDLSFDSELGTMTVYQTRNALLDLTTKTTVQLDFEFGFYQIPQVKADVLSSEVIRDCTELVKQAPIHLPTPVAA